MRTYEPSRKRSGAAQLAPALLRPVPASAVFGKPAVLHDFGGIRIFGDPHAAAWLGGGTLRVKHGEAFEDDAGQAADPELKRAAAPDDGGTRPANTGMLGPADAGVPVPTDAGTTAAKPTLAASNDSYNDTASESHKKIRFDVTVPSGLTARDYALVNKVKGFFKDGAGKFFKVTMYEKTVDANYSDWMVDSVDKDPVYWSTAAARWNFTTTPTGFYATDNPGPALSTEKGAVYAEQYKMGLYKLSDLPAETTGTISATPLSEVPWQYSVVVGSDGKFTHPAI
jgi:hypothetical protein